MEGLEGKLFSLGFKPDQGDSWIRGNSTVQVAHYKKFLSGSLRVSWREEWKDYLAIIFDYSSVNGPICIVPTRVFFESHFVSEKRKMPSYINSGYTWSQPFKLQHELPQLLLRYKDKWEILGGKTAETVILQKDFPVQSPLPQPLTKTSEKIIGTKMEITDFTNLLLKKFSSLPMPDQKIITEVWDNKADFIKWPKESILLFPGLVRPKGGFHRYSPDMIGKLKAKGIKIDSRTNGPAIMSFLYASGERPLRRDCNNEWTIHHIYDGKFPFEMGQQTLRAVKDGNHFTQSAGLVAIHPIADALADEYFYFAWLLRLEAFKRFEYDPDNVFGEN